MKCSINKKYVGKPDGDTLKAMHGHFNNHELELHELFDLVAIKGFAFSAQYNGRRSAANFAGSNILAADIDSGLTLEAVLADEWVKQHVAFVYTTPSHTPAHNHFRIVVASQRTITSDSEMRQALQGLLDRFGGDEACKDASRIFFGNPKSQASYFGKTISEDELGKLIQRGKERASKRKIQGHMGSEAQSTNLRSSVRLPRDLIVVTDSGQRIPLLEVTSRTRILCPQHSDTNASAFVTHNRRGDPVVYCSKCASSFYVQDREPSTPTEWFDYSWTPEFDTKSLIFPFPPDRPYQNQRLASAARKFL